MRTRIGAPRTSRNALEQSFARALAAAGIAFEQNVKGLPGTPDFVAGKVALFVHGCYWHGCPTHARPGAREFAAWRARVESAAASFSIARRALWAHGFDVRVAWEHDEPSVTAAIVAVAMARKAIGASRLPIAEQ